MALFRSLAEPFRLEYASAIPLTFAVIKPFLLASMACGFGLLGMHVSNHYKKYWITVGLAISTIVAMILIKIIFMR